MGGKILMESSSISNKNFKTAGKNMSPSASNFEICAYDRAVSGMYTTLLDFMESHGEKIKFQKN